MISHKHKFIFVHIPKTGGTSIMKALRPYGLLGEGHYTLSEIQNNHNLTALQMKEYFKFAVVRNPWDIVASNYHYSRMKKSFWHSEDTSAKYPVHVDYDVASKIDFAQYVDLMIKNKLNHRFSMLSQSHFVDGDIDHLLRFEDLNSEFLRICERIGLPPISLEKANPSKHNHYSTHYDATTIELVRNYFKQDIERFNYSFERK